MHGLNFVEKVQNELYLKGGFSFNLDFGFNTPKLGYMVGGLDEVLNFETIEDLPKGKDKILRALEKYGNKDPYVFLGGWKDKEGKIHIEPSELFVTKSFSLQIEAERKQTAIYDLREGQDILIPKGEENGN